MEGPLRTVHSVAEFVQGYEREGRLRGLRCPSCGFLTATWGVACSRCGTTGLVEADLGDRGTVVAFTIVAVPTEELVNDAPYAYIVVDLDGGARISGWMPSVRSPGDLAVGQRVRFRPSYKPGIQFERETDPPATG